MSWQCDVRAVAKHLISTECWAKVDLSLTAQNTSVHICTITGPTFKNFAVQNQKHLLKVLVPPLKTRTRIKREQRAAADQGHSFLFNLKSCDSDRWKAEALPVSRIHVKMHVVFVCLHFTPATAKHNCICFILCIN